MPISSAQHAFIAGTKSMTNQRKSKLTSPQVMTIFSLRPNNSDNRIVCTSTELAVYYKVSRESIKNIWNGRTWGVETGMVYNPHRHEQREINKTTPPTSLDIHHSDSIDNQLFNWANSRFVHKRLFIDDSITNLN
jgi:hypothetical protein